MTTRNTAEPEKKMTDATAPPHPLNYQRGAAMQSTENPTAAQVAVMSSEGLRVKLRYRLKRLALAESLGYPAHTARCRARVAALEIKISALETR